MAHDKETLIRWLAASARTGEIDKLKELVMQGAQIDASDGVCTPLMLAAAHGHREYVDMAIRLGAHVNCVSREGKTAVQYANEAGHAAVVEFLLEHGAHDAKLESERDLAASSAIGPDVDAPDEYGVTPLMRAVDQGRERLVDLLIARGADVHAATCFGHTALMIAVYKGHAAIVEQLFQAGARLPSHPVLLPSAETFQETGVADLIDQFDDGNENDPADEDSPQAEGASARLWERRIRVGASDLSLADLERHPFWERCGDGDDGTHIRRPVPFVEPLDNDVRGEVLVEFTLADGTRYPGCAFFDGFGGEHFVQDAQPHLALAGEWINFYFTILQPSRETLDAAYRALGKEPSQVFPIRVRSAVELKGQPREGVLDGFAWYDCSRRESREVKIVR